MCAAYSNYCFDKLLPLVWVFYYYGKVGHYLSWSCSNGGCWKGGWSRGLRHGSMFNHVAAQCPHCFLAGRLRLAGGSGLLRCCVCLVFFFIRAHVCVWIKPLINSGIWPGLLSQFSHVMFEMKATSYCYHAATDEFMCHNKLPVWRYQ